MFSVCKALGADGCCQGEDGAEVSLPEVEPIPIQTSGVQHVQSDMSWAPIAQEPSGPSALSSLPVSPQTSPHGALQRMSEGRHMAVDAEITRGIPLHRALRRSELWSSPQELRRRGRSGEVWALSRKTAELDIFLSHTWRTKGRWKTMALMMQTGWLHGLLAWFMAVAVMLCLRIFEVVDDPWKDKPFYISGRQVNISLTPWTVIAGQFSLAIGLYLSPYIPFKTQMCFLDVACIHQEDADMFQRGIYNIGGCLSVTKELRVLYTPAYLSSLWCVFEITGFRKAKPGGRLNFSPLFIERSSVICALIMWLVPVAMNFVLSYADEDYRLANYVVFFLAFWLLPMMFVVQTLRHNFREKLRLISDLKTFDVEALFCSSAFDREFILSAISSWYGSREAFNEFVRSTLREELLGLLPWPYLPISYAALIFSALFAWVLDFGVSMSKVVSFEEIPLFSVSQVSCYICWFWFAFNGIFYLSDKSAAYAGTRLCDWLKTLAVAGGAFLFILLGFAVWIQVVRANNVVGKVCYVAFSMLLPCFILDVFKACRPRKTA